jgi:uncharacterized protein (TIGR03083 family)
MAELADLYEQIRNDISELVAGLEPAELDKAAPATPGWTIRNIVTHLAGDATCAVAGDFPSEFFQAFGEPAAVTKVNNWTERQLEDRADRSLEELLQEWKDSAVDLTAMMRGEKPWPEGLPTFADRVLLTDATVHQQDIFGALGLDRERESAPIKIGLGGYIATMGWRLGPDGLPPLRFDVGDKSYTAGDGEPGATVHASRFELFRALSGRRTQEQIASYRWDGDPQPYIPYFYPYGVRQEALDERP